MSSYLDNIVMRTLSLAPVARPRLASLFELGGANLTVATQAPVQQELSNQDLTPVAKPVHTSSREVHTTVQLVPARIDEKDSTRSQNRTDVPVTKPVDKKRAAPQQAIEIHQTPKHKPAVEQSTELRSGRTREVVAKEVNRKPEAKPQVTPTDADVTPRKRSDLWPVLEPRIRELVREELPVEVNRERRVDEQPTPRPVAVTPPQKQDPLPLALTKPVILSEPQVPVAAPPPEIVVTIGRVDVRAVVSNAPALRREGTRSASPSSLDQYLKARNEGRR